MTSARGIALAVDLGGTKVEAALVTQDGHVLSDTRHRAPTGRTRSREGTARAVETVVTRALEAAPGVEVVGVGVGSAGPLSISTGTVSPLNLPAWRTYPLATLIRDITGLQPTVRLDGTCIVLAEHWVGALQNYRTALGMVVSTGVGGGLLVDGRIVRGRTGNAGHIGQIQLATRTSPGLDYSVTLEGIAAGPQIVTWARTQGWAGTSGEDLADAYKAGNAVAILAVQRCAKAIAEGISSVGALLDLEAVAIGGGFSKVSQDLFSFIRQNLGEIAPLSTMGDIRVVPSALSGDGPLIGAAGLVHRSDLIV
ncbi:ROK family protein [Herbiconiux sp. CPCC 205716]|uniref:ROK family protein n=1 Tax=Herbiconiux gentiana TaxID=2970912 RepID=A0ABT2GHQ6_9MICO|nr:ROK family protein [Herbiconiux gentiana]MCS5715760.1 ROK family protein [Herbiconiux gentiana]